jgi:hypothetical protein
MQDVAQNEKKDNAFPARAEINAIELPRELISPCFPRASGDQFHRPMQFGGKTE